ncbi:MAG: NOL1/NOP2/sun family putative RNA methylase [Lactimicrobium sp.]|jgi:NOL1/NOP2/sun family putative RNA methylase|uniref:NOL1/NOP2/sun family putative RNA methylase n=1 Tax=Lactimicrobium sp. TaxID=2563780 RepID=UPI002F350FC2
MNDTYRKRMQTLLGAEQCQQYFDLLDTEPRRGFRVNTLKIDDDSLFALTHLEREKTPFAVNGYYLHGETGLGATPAGVAGLFYMQEPSASAAVTILHPEKGMKVLDLCAAPGSKSTQIAEMLDHTGMLVTNEINTKRAGVLLENIERCGTANAMVLNSDTKHVADAFPSFFDAVLCDAPCSGEGMMRKNEEARRQWSEKLVAECAALQKEILDNAYACLKSGGKMVYSTCTFAPEENELQISSFLQRHPDMHTVRIDVPFGREALAYPGHTEYARRIYPMDGGEGHFICLMEKDDRKEIVPSVGLIKSEQIPACASKFFKENLTKPYPYMLSVRGRIYGGTSPFYQAAGCRLMRHQVFLGEERYGRFEPSHNLFTSAWGSFVHKVDLSDDEVCHYLRGEVIPRAMDRGWYAVCFKGYVLGGAHSDGKMLKNKYPKALRLR